MWPAITTISKPVNALIKISNIKKAYWPKVQGNPYESESSCLRVHKNQMLTNQKDQHHHHRNHDGASNRNSLKGVIFLVLTFSTPVIQPTNQPANIIIIIYEIFSCVQTASEKWLLI